MIKKIYPIFLVMIGFTLAFSSCLDSDDNDNSIDEDWMIRNEMDFYKAASDSEFKKIYGITDPNRYILWKESDFWTAPESQDRDNLINSSLSPTFSDTILCRYEGWYLTTSGQKIIFDSTENPTYFDKKTDPNKVEVTFTVSNLIDGWRVALYQMKEGDEWYIVIPYPLAYGINAYSNIPGCTTLYYQIKLTEVRPMKG